MIGFKYDDGGRKAAGFRGEAGDCFARAVSIATGLPYRQVYDMINEAAKSEKRQRGRIGLMAATGRGSSARTGVLMPTARRLLESLGWDWAPTMKIGSGCKVHLRADELPSGRIIARVSCHFVAVVDGVIHDTYDCSRNGTRCVYGYWQRSAV